MSEFQFQDLTTWPKALTRAPPKVENSDDSDEDGEKPYDRADSILCSVLNKNSRKCLNGVYSDVSDLGKLLNSAIASEVYVSTIHVSKSQVLKVKGTPFSLPMNSDIAKNIYDTSVESLVGVERRGDVLDTALRQSHEVLAQDIECPDALRFFDFPDEKEKVRLHLCPSAISIRAELYKLIVYGPGDFFVPHRDAIDVPNLFGTISMQIPILFEGDIPEREKSLREMRIRSDKSDVKGHGQLVFYVGRQSDDTMNVVSQDETDEFTMASARGQLAYILDLALVSEKASKKKGGKINSKDNIDLAFAAFTGDVLHEVRKIDFGYRAVFTYKLYKEGHTDFFIPRSLRSRIESSVATIFSRWAPLKGVSDGPYHYIGFTLRHGYPRAGLLPNALKGIDAIIYSIVSRNYKTILFSGVEMRTEYMSNRHFLVDKYPFFRYIFPVDATDRKFDDYSIGNDDSLEVMLRDYPLVTSTMWVQLGFGSLAGGGFCFGNWDSGTEWWYRAAYLLVANHPSRKSYIRHINLILERGPSCWGKLKGKMDILETILNLLD